MTSYPPKIASVLLIVFLFSGLCFPPGTFAADPAPVKRLKRLNPGPLCGIDDHPCIREIVYRQEDYLAALTEKEIADYEKKAKLGDADAMYLLSQIPKELPDGKREYLYRTWLQKAADAGHLVANYLLAKEAHIKRMHIALVEKRAKIEKDPSSIYLYALITGAPLPETEPPYVDKLQARAKELTAEDYYTGKPLTDESYLAIIEAAALAQGNGEIAWRLAISHASPTIDTDIRCSGDIDRHFGFVEKSPQKALHWARIAASKGNIATAEFLCNSFSLKSGDSAFDIPGRDAAEAVRWCTLAAQATCSSAAALNLSALYHEGIGVSQSAIDALYWKRIWREHRRMNYMPINKWEYFGGSSNELNHQ